MAVQTAQVKEEKPKASSLTTAFNAASFGDKLKESLEFAKNLFEKAPDGRSNLQHMLEDIGSELGEVGTVIKDIFNSLTSSAPAAAPPAPAPQTPTPQIAAKPMAPGEP